MTPNNSVAASRRLLLLTGIFPPTGGAGAVRLAKLAATLPSLGWNVDVIGPTSPHWFADTSLLPKLQGVQLYPAGSRWGPGFAQWRRANKNPEQQQSVLKYQVAKLGRWLRQEFVFPDEFAGWGGAAFFKAQQLMRTQHYDVLMTSSFPYTSHIVGLLLRAPQLPWLAEFRDPWTHPSFRPTNSWRSRLTKKIEQAVVEKAAAVTVVSPEMRQMFCDSHGNALKEKIYVVPNGYDPRDFSKPIEPLTHHTWTLVYVGTLDTQLHPIAPLLETLTHCIKTYPALRDLLTIRLVGGLDTLAAQALRTWREQNNAGDLISFQSFVSHEAAIREVRSADALLLTIGEHLPWVLTSKLFEYLASKKPIFAFVPNGDARTLLSDYGGAQLFFPNEIQQAAQTLWQATQKKELDVPHLHDHKVAEHTFDAIAKQLANLLNTLAPNT